MKKNTNKKVIGIIAIMIIIAIAGIFYMKNKPNNTLPSAPITATVRKASFSCVVNVTLSDAGKKQYKDVIKYQVFYDGKAASPKTEIGKPSTAYPVRKEKDKVAVKLLKSDGKVAYSVDLNLQKGEEVKGN